MDTTKPYQVTFYRELVNSTGRRHRSTLYTVEVRHARDDERAKEAAKWRFQRAYRLRNWRDLASGLEASALEDSQSRLGRGAGAQQRGSGLN